MAYGPWQLVSGDYHSRRVWNRYSDYSGGTVLVYSIDIKYRYCQDVVNNKTMVEVAKVVLNQHLAGWGMSGCTMHVEVGINNNNSGEMTTVISGGPPNSITINTYKYIELNNNSDGSFPFNIGWRCWVDSSDSHRPNFTGWQSFNPNIPSIDNLMDNLFSLWIFLTFYFLIVSE